MECVICLAPLAAGGDAPLATISCKHHFHAACLHRWVTEGVDRVDLYEQLDAKQCPVCRRGLSTIELAELGCFDTPLDAPARDWRWGGPADLRLNWAARQGDLVRARALLCMEHPVGKATSTHYESDFPPDKYSIGPLLAVPMLEAIAHGHLEIVRAFLEAGLAGHCHHCECNGLTLAAERGNVEMVRLFLEHGEKLDDPRRAQIGYTDTPLTAAAEAGKVEMVGFLLDCGAEIEAFIDNESAEACTNGTPLMMACKYNHLEVVVLLLARGADPAHYNEGDYGPLDCALTCDHTSTHASPQEDRAAKDTQLKIVRLLSTDVRVDPNHENEQGQTAREMARWYYGGSSSDHEHTEALVAQLRGRCVE